MPVPEPVEHQIEVRRTARYYTLGPRDAREAWVVLHGYGQLAARFITYFGDLDDGARLIVAPEALNRCYLASVRSPASERPVGATWMTREDRDAEMADYIAYLDQLVASLDLSGRRVIVMGFSQGAATASRWLASGRTRVDGFALWGGTTPPDLDVPALARHLGQAPVRFVVGSTDEFVTGANVEAAAARLAEDHIATQTLTFDGGHALDRDTLAALARSFDDDRVSRAADR